MIVIQKDRHGVTITGHAGYEEPGKDIVCAAVSVLVQTLAASAKRLTADRLEVEYRQDLPGFHTMGICQKRRGF